MSAGLSPTGRAARPPRNVLQGWVHGAVLFAYLLLTLVMTWPLATQFTTAIPGDAFDGWQNYWNLWWVKVALVERVQNPYATDLLYYPTGVTLYFHTLNPFNGLVTLPIQLTAGLIAAYNAVVLVSWVLAGYGTWLLARWVIGYELRVGFRHSHPEAGTHWVRSATRNPLRADASQRRGFLARVPLGRGMTRSIGYEGPEVLGDVAAFVAGAIFTFAPLHMAHLLGHMQVMALQWLPFYVLALLRGMQRARVGKAWWRDGLLAGFFLTLAGLCDWYFVLYLFLFTGVVILWSWLRAWLRREGRWRVWLGALGPAAVAGAVFALLLAPLLVPMVYEATHYSFMVRPASDLYIFSATVLDFLLPNRLHTLFRPESFGAWGNQIAPVSERTIGLGYGALALAMVAGVALRRRAALWVVATLVFVLLALGPRMHAWAITLEDIPADVTNLAEWSPYALVNRLVPFMRISRSVSRFAIVAQLCVAVLAGLGLAWWMGRLRIRVASVVGVVALVVVLAESWVAPYPMSPPDTPSYYASLAQQPGNGALLNLPMNYDRPGYLLYQSVHHRPLAVAYISREDPRTLTERVPLLQHWRHLGPDIIDVDPAQVGMTVLQDLGVEIVVLDRYKMPGGEEREYTEAVANALFVGQEATFTDDRITVYTVLPPKSPQAYLELGPLNWGALSDMEGVQSRAVGEAPADLRLRHAERGAQVVIEYRSDGEGVVSSADGSSWKLPASPAGGMVTLELPPGVDVLTLVALSGQVRITRLALEVPQD